jgi:hypothetical protein
MNNVWYNSKLIKLITTVYVILSIPPVLYVSKKMIGKIKSAVENRSLNSDFVLTNESYGGGGGEYTLY